MAARKKKEVPAVIEAHADISPAGTSDVHVERELVYTAPVSHAEVRSRINTKYQWIGESIPNLLSAILYELMTSKEG